MMEKLKVGDMVIVETEYKGLFGRMKKREAIGFILLKDKSKYMVNLGSNGIWWFDKKQMRKVKEWKN